MRRLTKAQLKVLDDIRRYYPELLQRGLEYHKEKLAAASEDWEVKYHKEYLENYEQGFISWASKNSRDSSILESLQEHGYIDYEHGEAAGQLIMDWVRLK